jgi:hypothetical protein
MGIFLKIFNEESMDKLTLDSIRGGANNVCGNGSSFTCTSFKNDCSNNGCVCNGNTLFVCEIYTYVPNPSNPDNGA